MVTDIKKEMFINGLLPFLNRQKYKNFSIVLMNGIFAICNIPLMGVISWHVATLDSITIVQSLLYSTWIIFHGIITHYHLVRMNYFWQMTKAFVYQISLLRILKDRKDITYDHLVNIYSDGPNIDDLTTNPYDSY